MSSRPRGFTLIELLVVVAIIAITISLLAPALTSVRVKALAIVCQSNLHQMHGLVNAYLNEYEDTIPYIVDGPGAVGDPRHFRQPATNIPTISGLFHGVYAEPLRSLMCPADTGNFGHDLFPTPLGVSCFEYYGQSHYFNSACYVEPDAPGYDARKNGPMYGSVPVPQWRVTKEYQYILMHDLYPYWHSFSPPSGEKGRFAVNALFFDGHVEWKAFATEEEALKFTNSDARIRWWREPQPAPE